MATAGPRKKLGPQGPKGDTPQHEWNGPRLRFENPDGSWGEYENLKGPKGPKGEQGERGPGGANGRNGRGVPPGGEDGQVLTKVSGADYHTAWEDPGTGGAATQAPKLIEQFDTDAGTLVGDPVRVIGTDTVQKIDDNLATTIPSGIFGVVTSKPSSILANVLFIGIQGGYSGLTPGLPVWVQEDGSVSNGQPATGVLQQVGFAITTTSIFFNLSTPIIR